MIDPGRTITLISTDTVNVYRTVPTFVATANVMQCSACKFFYNPVERPPRLGPAGYGAEFIPLPSAVDRESENRFQVCELHKHIQTDFVFTAEWDSWIVNPEAWSDDFLKYDYIGAPWWFGDEANVGNSGFSIRSKRFLEATAANSAAYEGRFHPHDLRTCRELRGLYTAMGLTFAPDSVAARFSWECNGTYPHYNGAFGAHGILTLKDLTR
jgi:hypothetical protein